MPYFARAAKSIRYREDVATSDGPRPGPDGFRVGAGIIESFIADGIRPVALCVEFDQPVPLCTVLRSIRLLQQSGYRLLCIEDWNYTFVSTTCQVAVENS